MYFKCDAYETNISSFKIFGNKCVIPGSVNPAKKTRTLPKNTTENVMVIMGIVLVLMETIFDYWYVMDYIGGMLNPNGKREWGEKNWMKWRRNISELKIFESFIEKNQQKYN